MVAALFSAIRGSSASPVTCGTSSAPCGSLTSSSVTVLECGSSWAVQRSRLTNDWVLGTRDYDFAVIGEAKDLCPSCCALAR